MPATEPAGGPGSGEVRGTGEAGAQATGEVRRPGIGEAGGRGAGEADGPGTGEPGESGTRQVLGPGADGRARGPRRGALRWQVAEVVAVLPEARGARRIRLGLPDWPGHLPGQHVDVRLTAEDGYTAQRSYSLASPPESAELDLVVERIADGEVSPFLTDELRAGDRLEVRGPIGRWFVWPGADDLPVQLVAGGSGVVPFLAMLGHHRASGRIRPVRLLCSVRTDAELIGRAELAAAATVPGVDVALTYTRRPPPSWAGETGRVDEGMLARLATPPDERPHVLVCGSTGFVETVAQALERLDHAPDRVRTERYGGLP